MRLIDADALIADIRKNSSSYFADDFAREWVDKQPTVEPSAGWISVEDRLPKENEKVWVTTKWGDVTDGKRISIPGCWFIMSGFWNAFDDEIIAWKPYSCPKPYESKEDK